jgi:hypothetical protein
LHRGDRIWNTSPGRVLALVSPIGGGEWSTSISTDPNTGRAMCYIQERQYDYMVKPAGESGRLFIDAVGSYVMR